MIHYMNKVFHVPSIGIGGITGLLMNMALKLFKNLKRILSLCFSFHAKNKLAYTISTPQDAYFEVKNIIDHSFGHCQKLAC